MSFGKFVMCINFKSKYYQPHPDNADRGSLELSIRGVDENEKYYQNINISMYGYGGDYG